MDAQFWHDKWEKNQIGFHEAAPNPLLTQHFPNLSLTAGSSIFLPLCGKTLDIGWLLSQGVKVIGAELSELAVKDLFADLGITPTISAHGQLKLYAFEDLSVYVGDIFDLQPEDLQGVDAIYDRAALVALPDELRKRYSAHLRALTNNVTQLLVTFSYDQTQMQGPPFSISKEEVAMHYQEYYDIEMLSHSAVEGGLKGQPASETTWLLKRPASNDL